MKFFKCPFCEKKYSNKKSLYLHMESEHSTQLNESSEGKKITLPASQIYFNYNNKYLLYKKNGTCIICSKYTEWNEQTEKYNRLCKSEKCAQDYRDQFKKRMIKIHNKVHLLNDPEQQKKMLSNRKISGSYLYNDREITYTGSLERKFLEFLHTNLEWDSEDILMPAPQIYKYSYKGSDKFHIPDVFIPSLSLVVNIKSEDNKHYRLRDIDQELEIDKAISNGDKNLKYIKLYDGNHKPFLEFLKKYKIKKGIN